ncbi:MAG: hypothetical protein V2B13_16675 [Pseudomonadota bacterium]
MIVLVMLIIMTVLVGMLLGTMLVFVPVMGMSHLLVLMLVFMLLVVMTTHPVFTSFFRILMNLCKNPGSSFRRMPESSVKDWFPAFAGTTSGPRLSPSGM